MDLHRGGVAMETLTLQGEPSHPPGADADLESSSSPRCVLLPRFGEDTDIAVVAGSKTSAASCTSAGRRFGVSFRPVQPPEISRFCYGWLDPHADDEHIHIPNVIAAHGDCILLEVTTPSTATTMPSFPPRPLPSSDYFLYQASAAGRAPSLLLLPPCYIPSQYDRRRDPKYAYPPKPRFMVPDGTGLLRHGEDDILVAQLELEGPEKEAGELCLLHLSRDREWQWQLKRLPIIVDDNHNKGRRDDDSEDACDDGPLRWWHTDVTFTVGDRFLWWVDYHYGFLLSDMAADEVSLRLRYVPLPVVPPSGNPSCAPFGRPNMGFSRNLAPAGVRSVRFVDRESRCCCGDPGSTSCARGEFLFTVTTWTLKLSMDEPTEWVKDGVLDCDDLWAQPGYEGLPRVTLRFPVVVNSNDPDAVCFFVCADYRVSRKVWTIEVDTEEEGVALRCPLQRR